MGSAFQREQLVRFGHCDPAGIVFYPRYFEMLNELIEDWFAHGLGLPFDVLIGRRQVGMPTAQLDTRFLRVSRHGDRLVQTIRIERLGGAGHHWATGHCGGAGRGRGATARQRWRGGGAQYCAAVSRRKAE